MGLFRIFAGVVIVFAVVQAGENSPATAVATASSQVQSLSEGVKTATALCTSRPELCVTIAATGAELARRETVQRLMPAVSSEKVPTLAPAPSRPVAALATKPAAAKSPAPARPAAKAGRNDANKS